MEIAMPINFFANYEVVVKSGGTESRERIQKLAVSELPQREGAAAAAENPTHLVVFFSYGCRRVVEGKLTVNEKERVVFQAEGKEYEFTPFNPAEKGRPAGARGCGPCGCTG